MSVWPPSSRFRLLRTLMTGVLVTAAGKVGVCAAQCPPTEEHIAGEMGLMLDQGLSRLQYYGFSGSVLVERRQQLVLSKGYGLASRERALRNGPATVYDFASLAKTFTAAAVMRLADYRILSLDDSITRWLGPFPEGKAAATVRHLMNHSAGLVAPGANLQFDSRDDFVQSMRDAPMDFAPGANVRYSNEGMALLAVIVEMASGLTYEDYVRTELLERVHLKNTVFPEDAHRLQACIASGYSGQPGEVRVFDPLVQSMRGLKGSIGLLSTVTDVAHWFEYLWRENWFREMATSPQTPAHSMAYGWQIDSMPDGKTVVHKPGALSYMQSHVLYFPEEEVLIVWAHNNMQQEWRNALNALITGVLFGGEYVLPPPVAESTHGALNLAGRYGLATDSFVQVREGEGYLYIDHNSIGVDPRLLFYQEAPLRYVSFDPHDLTITELIFQPRAGGPTILTVRMPDGNEVRLRAVREFVQTSESGLLRHCEDQMSEPRCK